MAMVVGGCAQVNDTELMPALSTAFSDEAASSDGFETIFDQQRKERAAEAEIASAAAAAAEAAKADAADEADKIAEERSQDSPSPDVAASPATGKVLVFACMCQIHCDITCSHRTL